MLASNTGMLSAPGPASCPFLHSMHAESINQHCIHFTTPAGSDDVVMSLKCLLELLMHI